MTSDPDTTRARLHAAISSIAAVCDYAVEQDGQGFNSTDASVGHYLATIAPADWSDEHEATALGILPTYRRQLDGTLDDLFAASREAAREEYLEHRRTVLDQARRHRAQQRRKAKSYVHLTDAEIILGFPYDPDLVAESSHIPGRRFHGPDKTNRYPLSSLPQVAAFAERHGIDLEPDVLAVLRDVLLHPETYLPVNVTLDSDGVTLHITSDYEPALNAALYEANHRVSTWDRQHRRHRIRLDRDAAGLLTLLRDHKLRIAPEAEQALSEAARNQPERRQVNLDSTGHNVEFDDLPSALTRTIRLKLREIAGSVRLDKTQLKVPLYLDPRAVTALITDYALNATPEALEALNAAATEQDSNLAASIAISGDNVDIPGIGVTLMPHQHAGVAYALRNRRLIIADEMGLGKTITSLATIAAADAFPAIVACKPDLTENWQNEIHKVLPGRRVFFASGMTPTEIPADAEIIVIGFAALGSRSKNERHERFLWAEQLLAHHPLALIIDEGHLGKEVSAARSRALSRIGAAIAEFDGIVLDLTGTPLVNRPRELAQQLVTLGYLAPKNHPVSDSHRWGEFGGFLFRYCGPVDTGYGWTFNGHSHTSELHRRLRAWGLYLRRGQEALDLPPFTMSALPLSDGDLDADAMTAYREAENAVIADFTDEAVAFARKTGATPTSSGVREAMAQQSAEHLVRLNTLRQLIGRAKMPAVSAWVQDQIATGEKVMIAAHHRSIVSSYAKQFGGLKIQGGQSAAEKEADKAAFQQAPADKAPVITVSIGAGGVGHTLHAARLGIQAELCWTPGERSQMAKRIHRIGQHRPVSYLVAVAPGTIDESMWEMLESKQHVLDQVLDGAAATTGEALEVDQTAAAAAVAWKLVERGLAQRSSSANVTS